MNDTMCSYIQHSMYITTCNYCMYLHVSWTSAALSFYIAIIYCRCWSLCHWFLCICLYACCFDSNCVPRTQPLASTGTNELHHLGPSTQAPGFAFGCGTPAASDMPLLPHGPELVCPPYPEAPDPHELPEANPWPQTDSNGTKWENWLFIEHIPTQNCSRHSKLRYGTSYFIRTWSAKRGEKDWENPYIPSPFSTKTSSNCFRSGGWDVGTIVDVVHLTSRNDVVCSMVISRYNLPPTGLPTSLKSLYETKKIYGFQLDSSFFH